MLQALDVPFRVVAAAAALVAAMVLSLVFYGTAVNLLILALVDALLLLSLVLTGPRNVVAVLAQSRGALVWLIATLGYLVIAYRVSLSPANSFAPSWVLASGPLAFLGAAAVVRRAGLRQRFAFVLFGLVIVLAMNSCVRFLLHGERAHEPLVDANGYGSLLYLVWIPFVHFNLSRAWRGATTDKRQGVLAAAASFVMVLALLATRSRTSALVVVVALVCWAMIVVVRRVAWRPLVVQILVVVAAVVVSRIVSSSATATIGQGLEMSGGLTVRLELIRAAFEMLAAHPFGIGVFCFPLLYPSFRSIQEQDTAGLFVHNDYVQFLVEGGLPLLLLLLVFVVAVVRRVAALARRRPDDPDFHEFGVALALAAACAHAIVNFVFYDLPIGILMGLLAAYLFVPVAIGSMPARSHEFRIATGALTVAWFMWLYLLLDVAIAGVFQGQPGVPFAAAIRADERSMLQFARVAQRVNGNRGLPTLSEAVLLHRALQREPGSSYLREQTDTAFQRALAVDPWNSLIYLRFAQFLDEFPPRNGRREGESDEELLAAAIGLDPLFTPGIDRLLALYAAQGDDARRFTLLRNFVYPWMPTLRKRDPAASDRYFDLLRAYADAAGDSVFSAEVERRRAELSHIVPVVQTRWFF